MSCGVVIHSLSSWGFLCGRTVWPFIHSCFERCLGSLHGEALWNSAARDMRSVCLSWCMQLRMGLLHANMLSLGRCWQSFAAPYRWFLFIRRLWNTRETWFARLELFACMYVIYVGMGNWPFHETYRCILPEEHMSLVSLWSCGRSVFPSERPSVCPSVLKTHGGENCFSVEFLISIIERSWSAFRYVEERRIPCLLIMYSHLSCVCFLWGSLIKVWQPQ